MRLPTRVLSSLQDGSGDLGARSAPEDTWRPGRPRRPEQPTTQRDIASRTLARRRKGCDSSTQKKAKPGGLALIPVVGTRRGSSSDAACARELPLLEAF